MPRELRQFQIGSIYHIVKRGVENRKIFLKDQDNSRFILGLEFFNTKKEVDIWALLKIKHSARGGSDPPLAELVETLKKERENIREPIVELLAFVLMPNHFHLVIREIVNGGISLFMQKIGGYSIYFNQQYSRTGSLFQSRYKCIKIEDDVQLMVIFNYVHTNPIALVESGWKNQQVKNFNNAKKFLENYKWSSYKNYIEDPTFLNVIKEDYFLKFFEDKKTCKKEIEDWIKFKANNYIQNKILDSKKFE